MTTIAQRALAILDDEQQIAAPDAVMGDKVTNHVASTPTTRAGCGGSRRSPSYVAGKPQWRTLIDVDALGKAEGKSWVWHGADCLAPEYRRCLVSLSPGGTDADVVREFDLATGKFVAGGFSLPEAKTSAAWVDADHLLVGDRLWRRAALTSVRLSAHRQAVEARHAARVGRRPCSPARAERRQRLTRSPMSDGDRRWTLRQPRRRRRGRTTRCLLPAPDGR